MRVVGGSQTTVSTHPSAPHHETRDDTRPRQPALVPLPTLTLTPPETTADSSYSHYPFPFRFPCLVPFLVPFLAAAGFFFAAAAILSSEYSTSSGSRWGERARSCVSE